MTEKPTQFDRWVAEHKSDPDFVTAQALMEITGQISTELKRQGKSRSDLARLLNIDRAQVSRILNGHPNMTIKTLVKAALALGQEIDFRLVSRSNVVVESGSVSLAAPSARPVKGENWQAAPLAQHFKIMTVSRLQLTNVDGERLHSSQHNTIHDSTTDPSSYHGLIDHLPHGVSLT